MKYDSTPHMIALDNLLSPSAINPNLIERLRRLANDLEQIATGEAPAQTDLEYAPLLVDWRLMLTLSGLSFVGFVAGHPLLGTKSIATSPVWVLDPQLKWARTLSRFYRLGVPAGGAIPTGDATANE